MVMDFFSNLDLYRGVANKLKTSTEFVMAHSGLLSGSQQSATFLSLPLGVASYRTKSQELADAFDRVIESFCCNLEMLSK